MYNVEGYRSAQYYLCVTESHGVLFFVFVVKHIWGQFLQAAICGVWNDIMIKMNHFPLQIQSHCMRTHNAAGCMCTCGLICTVPCTRLPASYILWCPLQYNSDCELYFYTWCPLFRPCALWNAVSCHWGCTSVTKTNLCVSNVLQEAESCCMWIIQILFQSNYVFNLVWKQHVIYYQAERSSAAVKQVLYQQCTIIISGMTNLQ